MRLLRSKQFYRVLLAFGLSFLLSFYFIVTKPTAEIIEIEETTWPVLVETIQIQPLSPMTILHGQVESPHTALLKSAITAYVKYTPGQEGIKVGQGTPLVQLDPTDAVLALAQKKAEVLKIENEIIQLNKQHTSDQASLAYGQELIALLKKSVERETKLAKRSVGSQSRIEEAEQAAVREAISVNALQLKIDNYEAVIAQNKARLAIAKAQEKLAALDVERTQIKAPFTGIIVDMQVAPGDRVMPNSPLVEMYESDHLEIRAQISTKELPRIQKSFAQQQPITATIELPQQSIRATLDRIGGQITRGQGGIDALFKVEDGFKGLRLGQAVKLLVRWPQIPNVVMVPLSSLYEMGGQSYVYKVIENGQQRLERVLVTRVGQYFKASIAQAQALIVQETLQDGDKILSTRLPNARDGLKVIIQQE